MPRLQLLFDVSLSFATGPLNGKFLRLATSHSGPSDALLKMDDPKGSHTGMNAYSTRAIECSDFSDL